MGLKSEIVRYSNIHWVWPTSTWCFPSATLSLKICPHTVQEVFTWVFICFLRISALENFLLHMVQLCNGTLVPLPGLPPTPLSSSALPEKNKSIISWLIVWSELFDLIWGRRNLIHLYIQMNILKVFFDWGRSKIEYFHLSKSKIHLIILKMIFE